MTDKQKALEGIIHRRNDVPLSMYEFEVLQSVKAALEAKEVDAELLEALKELVEIERRDELTDPARSVTDAHRSDVWNKARAAISRAEAGRGK